MVINASSVGMTSKSSEKKSIKQNYQTFMSNLSTGEIRFSQSSFSATYEHSWKENESNNQDEPKALASEPYTNSLPSAISVREDSRKDFIIQLKFFLLEFRNRLSLLIGKRDNSIRNKLLGGKSIDLTTGSSDNFNVWNRVDYYSYEYSEQASLRFETMGHVLTADGRKLDFNLQIEMTREYYESTEVISKSTEVIMTDPLVISLDSSPISVSDQKWKFDIDGDGKDDSISLLSKGAGFLCYDKNQDGIINDGNEMFGSKSGNGFKDLSEYDKDGNGWIDEADEIFDKLSVWVKDASGNDKVISLRDAKLGAIYLGNKRSDFSLNSNENNQKNAQIRRSGVYLHENGTAGIIQQLDMVKHA